jgi:hypothetical protein
MTLFRCASSRVAAAQIRPRAGHGPTSGRARAERADRAELATQLPDHGAHPFGHRERCDVVRSASAVGPVEAEASGPVRGAGLGLAVAPAEQDRPGDRAAADRAAGMLELVVERLRAMAAGHPVG